MKRVAFMGTKGGVGCTILASLTAHTLGLQKRRVLLVESNNHGDLVHLFGLDSYRSLGEALEHFRKKKVVSGEFLSPYLSYPNKLDLILSKPGENLNGKEKFVLPFIEKLDKNYDHFIFDAGSSFDETTFSFLDIVEHIFLVIQPELTSIARASHFIELSKEKYYAPQKIEIVVNNFIDESSLSVDEIKKVLEKDVILLIEEDPKAREFINYGFSFLKEHSPNRVLGRISLLSDFVNGKRNRKELIMVVSGEKDKKLFGIFGRKKASKVSTEEIEVKSSKEEPKKGKEEAKVSLEEEVYTAQDVPYEVKAKIHEKVVREMTLSDFSAQKLENPEIREEVHRNVEKIIIDSLDDWGVPIASQEERKRFVGDMVKEILGLGPLEDLIADPSITEIMVNDVDSIYIEREGHIHLTDKRFFNESQLRLIIERIVAPIGRRVDESNPLCDSRLRDGSRVNITLPPVSIESPTITIRKFRKEPFSVEDLINFGTLTDFISEFLEGCVIAEKNIVVAGGTGSGKTTFLNVLSSFIPHDERIVTVEDTAELKLQQPHVVRMEARPPNVEGKGEIAIRDLVKNALRMRPDRIVVGECRSGEALDMLQAMNTGHEGSLTTVHSNSPRDTLSRLETMVLMAGMELPSHAIRSQIASAIDFIVFVARLRDGKRKVTKVTEVTGLEGDVITLQDIFIFKQEGVDEKGNVLGKHIATGIRPRVLEEFKIKGIKFSDKVFRGGKEW